MKREWIVRTEDLDSTERTILEETIMQKSLIVSGCAGSGKSLIAVKLAKRIATETIGTHKIIVYTKALEEFIREGARTIDFNTTLTHYHLWRNKYDRNGHVIGDNRTRTDFFIVDEIQDFSEEEIKDFIFYTNRHFLFFGDTAQSIYPDKAPLPVENIRRIIPDNHRYKEYTLYYNYRLPVQIAKAVQYVGDSNENFDEFKYKSKERTWPHIIKRSYDEQIKEIVRFYNDKRSSDIAILVPTKIDVIKTYEELKKNNVFCEIKYDATDPLRQGLGDFPDTYRQDVDTLNMSTDNPKIMTFHSSKGLQFETVFVIGIRDYNNQYLQYLRKPLYVAMTRTYKNLYVMYDGWMPHPLYDIPKNLYIDSMYDDKVIDK